MIRLTGKALPTLTDEEISVLPHKYNLADGHAYRSWTSDEQLIIDSAPALLYSADRRKQSIFETEYLEVFFELSKQTLRRDFLKTFMCFTASSALEVIANFLRLKKLSVALVEPCFDNLADILKRHEVSMTAIPDYLMGDSQGEFCEMLNNTDADAFFFVTPNNPTGNQLSQENFQCLVDFCRSNGKVLILDTCFRFYLPDEDIFDQYKILCDSEVDFIILEDTGKTWPTLEIKAPFFSVSPRLADEISDIYSDFILLVSPFSVLFLTSFLRLSLSNNRREIHEVIQKNREVLYRELVGTDLEPQESPFLSVAWLRLNANITGSELKELLGAIGVHILSGNQFFWSTPSKGDSYIRVSLSRDHEIFKESAQILGDVCRKLSAEGFSRVVNE